MEYCDLTLCFPLHPVMTVVTDLLLLITAVQVRLRLLATSVAASDINNLSHNWVLPCLSLETPHRTTAAERCGLAAHATFAQQSTVLAVASFWSIPLFFICVCFLSYFTCFKLSCVALVCVFSAHIPSVVHARQLFCWFFWGANLFILGQNVNLEYKYIMFSMLNYN